MTKCYRNAKIAGRQASSGRNLHAAAHRDEHRKQ
ncbi:hypothetical protein QOZ95_003252 [Paenibacillus brasilensis]|uniref:Uncharacterized protein n=1 Tax=Paenibacillus brasilensis TaxID=128574 RepID=A0ABU0L0L4_9BACL|nr:hypothetical protein [Paenibacillus brasilensis]